jgi:dephospho-CoA kinase
VPFEDELVHGTVVSEYDPAWPEEFAKLAAELSALLGSLALAVEHTGSTSVSGLAAKDCIDVMVLVSSVSDDRLVPLFEGAGFRCRPEPWNRVEVTYGASYPKLVFAPPVGGRRSNVHVRERTAAARYTLLFRDFLRADARARDGWGAFKLRLAQSVTDIYDYGQIKAPATQVLMTAAERWAASTKWEAFR